MFILLSLLAATSWGQDSTHLDTIDVTAGAEASEYLTDYAPHAHSTKLKGRELQKRRQTSLGDTLQQEAGMNSASFGPNASRPVIRGLDGDRIRILQNGLGTLDASSQSLDHAVPVDPLTIEQIEIIRGPMGLLYGSQAMGGVINLVTNKIHSHYEQGYFGQAMFQGETVTNGIASALHMNYGKNNWMLHADGSTRNQGDQKIPNYAKVPTDHPHGKVTNSASQQDNVGTGVSRIWERGYVGLSFNHFKTSYGTVAEEEVVIDMIQNRAELHGEYRPEGNFVKKWKFKSAYSDYSHAEIEEEITGTTFRNKGNESRLEAVSGSKYWHSVTGLHSQVYRFTAKGEEAFLPSTDNNRYAFFTYHEYHLTERQNLNFGGRGEFVDIEEKISSRDFFPVSGSVGHEYKYSESQSQSVNFSYSERSPNFQELFSEGPHLATGTFEQGLKTLTKEKAYGVELSYKIDSQETKSSLSAYSQNFKDFIVLSPTGRSDAASGLGIYDYSQVDALFYGMDFDFKKSIAKANGQEIWMISKADWVRAKNINTGKNLPRISPPRITLGTEFNSDRSSMDVEVQYVFEQSNISPLETKTDDYFMTNLGYHYRWVTESWSLEAFGRVRNIFDVVGRNHVSTLKDMAPLPGRKFIIGAQLQI